MIFFHIYSKIAAVFLTMALLFRCLLAYHLKKKANVLLFVLPKVYGGYAHGSNSLSFNSVGQKKNTVIDQKKKYVTKVVVYC